MKLDLLTNGAVISDAIRFAQRNLIMMKIQN